MPSPRPSIFRFTELVSSSIPAYWIFVFLCSRLSIPTVVFIAPYRIGTTRRKLTWKKRKQKIKYKIKRYKKDAMRACCITLTIWTINQPNLQFSKREYKLAFRWVVYSVSCVFIEPKLKYKKKYLNKGWISQSSSFIPRNENMNDIIEFSEQKLIKIQCRKTPWIFSHPVVCAISYN